MIKRVNAIKKTSDQERKKKPRCDTGGWITHVSRFDLYTRKGYLADRNHSIGTPNSI